MPSRCTDRRTPRYFVHLLAGLLSISLASNWCLALPDDREQPIHISADKALRDEKQGVTIYSGNVQMNQGSMHIEADRLTIYHIEAEADKIVARGRPAKMRQRPDLKKGPVHARALLIEYFQREQKVHLQDEARIEQDGAIVTGDSIDYFIAQELVKADSDGAGEGNRVQVVIPPSVQQDMNLAPRKAPANPAPPRNETPVIDPNEAAVADPNDVQNGIPGPTQQTEDDGGSVPAESQ
jgi:lipopolysaccharide export system protein LptA